MQVFVPREELSLEVIKQYKVVRHFLQADLCAAPVGHS